MQPSLAGLFLCAALFMAGRRLGAPLLIGLFLALPFGSTAFATLTALGGSSPLIYTLFVVLLIFATMSRRQFPEETGRIMRDHAVAWVVIGLSVYAIATALLLPRLFLGQTTAFVVYRGGILEVPLAPTSGNITQPAYFTLSALTFFVLANTLLRRDNLSLVRKGFFAFAGMNALLGALDLAGKLVGQGDVLMAIRTANYSLLTEIAEGGFWRIVGGHAEASSFAMAALSGLAFSFAYWRSSGSRLALMLAVASLMLAALSTSSTAYAGLGLLGIVLLVVMAKPLASGRIFGRDLGVLACLPVFLVLMLAVYLAKPHLFDPIINLLDTMLFNKASSASGQERAYWNARSLAALGPTMGMGVGLGSSRASSWMIAVISQLGIVGTLLMMVLVAELVRGPGRQAASLLDRDTLALYRGVRACGLATLLGASLSGAAADPGVLFFICLAVAVSIRHTARAARPMIHEAKALPRGARLAP